MMSMFQVNAIRTPEFAVVLGFAAFIVESGTVFLGLRLAIFGWPIGDHKQGMCGLRIDGRIWFKYDVWMPAYPTTVYLTVNVNIISGLSPL